MSPATARQRSPDKAKDQLMEAASQLMRENGSITITLSDVAARARLNSALVKYYFGNKEGLLVAVLERDVLNARDELTRLSARADLDPRSKMERHLTGLVNASFQYPYLRHLMLDLLQASTDDKLVKICQEIVLPFARSQSAILREGVNSGAFHPVDPLSFYFASVCAASGLYSSRFLLKSAFGIDAVTETYHRQNTQQIVSMLMRGLLRDRKVSDE